MHPNQATRHPAYCRWSSEELYQCLQTCLRTYPQDVPSALLPTSYIDLGILIGYIKMRQSMPLTQWFCRQLRTNRHIVPDITDRSILADASLPTTVSEDTKQIDTYRDSHQLSIGR